MALILRPLFMYKCFKYSFIKIPALVRLHPGERRSAAAHAGVYGRRALRAGAAQPELVLSGIQGQDDRLYEKRKLDPYDRRRAAGGRGLDPDRAGRHDERYDLRTPSWAQPRRLACERQPGLAQASLFVPLQRRRAGRVAGPAAGAGSGDGHGIRRVQQQFGWRRDAQCKGADGHAVGHGPGGGRGPRGRAVSRIGNLVESAAPVV